MAFVRFSFSNVQSPELMAGEAVESLRASLVSGSCVDEHMQDQLIIYMALAEGRSCIRTQELTLHTQTAIFIAEDLTDARFYVKADSLGTFLITCDGIGYRSHSS